MTEITPVLGLSAYLLGRRIAGQRRKREPVAWLYGEEKLRLPPLPEWDKEKYPYYFIRHYNNGIPRLYCLESYEYRTTDGWPGLWNIKFPKSSLVTELENGAWGSTNDLSNASYSAIFGIEIIWANFKLLNEDGSVYLEASKPDPIPVYE